MNAQSTTLRFLRSLPSLSPYLRLSIFFVSFFICGVFMILGLIVTNNRGLTPIFAIPVALAAWMFRPRQAALALGCILLMLIVINTVAVKSPIWPFPLIITFLCGIASSVIVAGAIGVLRYALNIAELTRHQSLLAEQQMLKAYKQEQHVNELKDQFLLTINHELRTPLTALHGYLQLIEDQQQPGPSTQSRFLDHALQSSEELVEMVNTILDAFDSDTTTLQPQYKELPLVPAIQNTIDLFKPVEWQSHRIDLLIDKNLKVKADQQFFHQIIWNLLSNACKYSPADTNVTIGARTETTSSGTESVCIWVRDTGPGIAPDEIANLFRKFVRLKRNQASTIRGMGLGLYISKNLVETMGGQIWAESSGVAGEGCCFYFTLPNVVTQTTIPSTSST
jgi:signal transduction histidine kinase